MSSYTKTNERVRRAPIKGKTQLNNKGKKVHDKRLSVCTTCRRGIFEDRNDYEWTRNGLVHKGC